MYTEQLGSAPVGAYSLPLRFRHSAADASGSLIWAIRNSAAARSVWLRRVHVVCGFDGTVVATESEFELVRLDSVSAFSGGTARTPGRRRTSYAASVVTAADNAILTLTNGVVIDTICAWGCTRQSQSAIAAFDFNWARADAPLLEAGVGNAFAIRLNAAAVIGDFFRGCVEWEER